MHFACFSNQPKMIEHLLKFNANILAEDNYKNLPVHDAAGGASPLALDILLAKNPEQLSMRTYEGETPHQVAKNENTPEVAEYFERLQNENTLRTLKVRGLFQHQKKIEILFIFF